MFHLEWDPARQQTVVWPLSDYARPKPQGRVSRQESRESTPLAASVTVEAFIQHIHAQLRVLSQEGPGAGNADHPGGLSHER